MVDQNMKNYQFVIGCCLVLIGILMFSFLSDPIRYFGFIFIFAAAFYFVNTYPSNNKHRREPGKFRSRTRDEMLRHQHRMK